MAIEIVDLPINSMVIFHCKMLVYQRVSTVCHELDTRIIVTLKSIVAYNFITLCIARFLGHLCLSPQMVG